MLDRNNGVNIIICDSRRTPAGRTECAILHQDTERSQETSPFRFDCHLCIKYIFAQFCRFIKWTHKAKQPGKLCEKVVLSILKPTGFKVKEIKY